MAKNLVIVESPAKSKTIQKFLGDDFEIKASFGHIRDLPAYTLGVDVENDYAPKYAVLKDKSKVLKDLKKSAEKAEAVYLATDPDREGEAIAWHILESVGASEDKVRRVVFHEITKKAVQDAINSPRKLNANLVDAQQARRILDRLIGYKLSPILSKKIRKGLSAGRVQSVAVKIICDREKEILAFVPQEYWVIEAEVKKGKSSFVTKLIAEDDEKNKIEILNEASAKDVTKQLDVAKYSVHSVDKKLQNRNPSAPFITSTLQQDASRKLNWSTKKTMLIAQQLYEGITLGDEEATGLITYMRTDSFRVSKEAEADAKTYIGKQYGKEYLPEKLRVFKSKKGAQDAHEAIRPSYVEKNPNDIKSFLTADQFKLYKLIWDRFIASQMASAKVEMTAVTVKAEGKKTYFLRANGQNVLFKGFTVLYSESKDEVEADPNAKANLPTLNKDDALDKNKIDAEQKFTQPPARFNEASLVKEMEEKGIGRPSTYAPTLSTILDRGYIEKEKRTLFPSELGTLVNDKLAEFFDRIIDINFTAEMETRLDEIMDGKHRWQNIVEEIYKPFTGMLDTAYKNMEKVNTDKPSDEICDKCGKPMLIKTGRFGEFLACSDFPTCKNAKSLLPQLDVPCPECGEALTEKRSRRGKVFYGCTGYPKCKYASWDKPVAESCPECKATPIFIKQSKGKSEVKVCAACKYEIKEVEPAK